MPTTLPQSLRGAIGDEATDDLEHWFEGALHERAVPRDEFREVLSRLDRIEREMGHVKSELTEQRRETGELRGEMSRMRSEMNERFDAMNERMDERFAGMNDRLDRQSVQFDQRLDKMNERFDRMNEQMRVQTRWTIGTIALIGIILSALLAIAEFAA